MEKKLNSFKSSNSLLATLVTSLLCTIPAHSENVYPAKPDKPLAFYEVNEQLHKNYAIAKDEIRQGLGPIIICTNESISLLKGKDRTTVPFIRPRYTGLKEVAHITLGTFVLLTNHTDENLNADMIERLQALKTGIEKAAVNLQNNEGLAPGEDASQEELIKKTTTFLSKVITDKRVSRAGLQEYVRACAVPDLENAYEAAGSQITTMDDALAQWHKEMTPEEWNKLHVIILTTHMPRQGLAAFQYFSKLLNQAQEGEQIIVSEHPSADKQANDEQAIDLLLTHILDGKVAVEFFKDPWRMHRDLLSDGATKYLQEHELHGNKTSK